MGENVFCRSVADKSDGDGLEGKAEEGRRGKRNWVCTKKWRVLRMVTEWEKELLPAGRSKTRISLERSLSSAFKE